MTTIFGSLTDKRYKNNFRGAVYKLDGGKKEVLCYVYGKTLKILRKRKKAIVALLQNSEA